MANVLVAHFIVPGNSAGTSLWASLKVVRLFDDSAEITDIRQRESLVQRLRSMCEVNLRTHLPATVKREFGKTYGIHLWQYRVVGFFDQGYRDFIALDYFVKKTQRNDRRMNAIYERVDSIREAGTWQRLD